MGTWISHLRIAENLLKELPGLDEAAFTVGNLAPDSGVPNEDWSAFDPPKTVTHFLRPGEEEGRIADLQFYREYLAPLSLDNDSVRYSFALGYFFHLLCDNLWAKLIVGPSKLAYATLFAAKEDAIWTVKHDWYDLDHCYVRQHPGSLFWRVLMTTPNPPAYFPFLSEVGLHHSLDHIRKFYSEDNGHDLVRSYPYLNETTMSRYVADSTAAVLKIYARLQEMPALANTQTALPLLRAQEISPYEPPLGDGQV
jgi:hypothetical protein